MSSSAWNPKNRPDRTILLYFASPIALSFLTDNSSIIFKTAKVCPIPRKVSPSIDDFRPISVSFVKSFWEPCLKRAALNFLLKCKHNESPPLHRCVPSRMIRTRMLAFLPAALTGDSAVFSHSLLFRKIFNKRLTYYCIKSNWVTDMQMPFLNENYSAGEELAFFLISTALSS